jgi:hypothetical protein
MGGISINSTILLPPHHHEILQNVENARHLRKNQDAIASFLELFEQFVHHYEFATILNQVLARIERAILHAIKEIGMPTALAQLHDNIENGGPILIPGRRNGLWRESSRRIMGARQKSKC